MLKLLPVEKNLVPSAAPSIPSTPAVAGGVPGVGSVPALAAGFPARGAGFQALATRSPELAQESVASARERSHKRSRTDRLLSPGTFDVRLVNPAPVLLRIAEIILQSGQAA